MGVNFDLEGKVPFCGTVDSRGMECVKILNETNQESGFFEHNGVRITVYKNSTPRELSWQYAAKTKK